MSNGILHMGQSIYDVRLIIGILDPLTPFVRISRNLSVLFVHQISHFPSPLSADVINGWPLLRFFVDQPDPMAIANMHLQLM